MKSPFHIWKRLFTGTVPLNKAYLFFSFYIAKHLKKFENTSLVVELQSWTLKIDNALKGYVCKNLLGTSGKHCNLLPIKVVRQLSLV